MPFHMGYDLLGIFGILTLVADWRAGLKPASKMTVN